MGALSQAESAADSIGPTILISRFLLSLDHLGKSKLTMTTTTSFVHKEVTLVRVDLLFWNAPGQKAAQDTVNFSV